ncbi:cupin domain-containing protein [Methanobacterium sp.]|uniref:cupin domain-containing protein n=1 Tax=Methanobacterium sp. TaxID=2164 RepID=UPI002AB8345B|nr:cupin domain-containing protein [Methanobacterium sp.]MDY9924176.1 cupin domain-containing protein [Methanobacterium sp.]
MLIKSIKNCEYFQVADETVLCELLHPKNENLKMGCSVAHALIEPGRASLPHKLKSSVEIYYIIEGEGRMHIDNESREVKPGDAIYIPPESSQWIENTGDEYLKFLCVVTPPWQEEDEELCD